MAVIRLFQIPCMIAKNSPSLLLEMSFYLGELLIVRIDNYEHLQ